MARAVVGDSSWLTVDAWEVTRRRTLDYFFVLEHARELFAATCFAGGLSGGHLGGDAPAIRFVYLAPPSTLKQLSPEMLRDAGHGCLTIARPRETDQLLSELGARWRGVAFIVEDTAVLEVSLERTSSSRVRAELVKAVRSAPPRAVAMAAAASGPAAGGRADDDDDDGELGGARAMIPPAVVDYLSRYRIGAKMAGRESWSERDKEFRLDGDHDPDRPYMSQSRRVRPRADQHTTLSI